MKKLNEILEELNLSLDIKSDVNYKNRVYVYNCLKVEDQSKFNLVADLRVSNTLNWKQLEDGNIKKDQRTEKFIFQLIDAVVFNNHYGCFFSEKIDPFRSYLNGEISIEELRKIDFN